MEGLIVLELEAGRARTAWLVGADDFLRPWEIKEIALTRDSTRRVLTPVTLLQCDARLGNDRAAPERRFSGAVRSSYWLRAKSLVTSSPSLEQRLLLLFALCGERWGKVRRVGIRLDLPLTHDLLATAARDRSIDRHPGNP